MGTWGSWVPSGFLIQEAGSSLSLSRPVSHWPLSFGAPEPHFMITERGWVGTASKEEGGHLSLFCRRPSHSQGSGVERVQVRVGQWPCSNNLKVSVA